MGFIADSVEPPLTLRLKKRKIKEKKIILKEACSLVFIMLSANTILLNYSCVVMFFILAINVSISTAPSCKNAACRFTISWKTGESTS